MRLTFRLKLIGIVAIAALAFIVIIVASTLIGNRADDQVAGIRDRYVPKVELGPRLEGQFERIRRGLQDAVAARDLEAMAKTGELKDEFYRQMEQAKDAVDPVQAELLRNDLEEYYKLGLDVSRRLIGGETGESIVGAMTHMQGEQTHTLAQLKKTAMFDREELSSAFAAAAAARVTATRVRLGISVACLLAVLWLSLLLIRGVLRSVRELSNGLERFGSGDFSHPIVVHPDELGDVALRANQMAANLQRLAAERDRADWLKSGHAELTQALRGELDPPEVASRAMRILTSHLDAPAGAFYYFDDKRVLRALASHAHSPAMPSFQLGEGLIGQAALQEQIVVVQDPPDDYLRIRSSLGEGHPRVIVLLPLLHLGKVAGVIELALFKPWTELYAELLTSVRETLTITVEVARARVTMRDLLVETQRQADRLAAQEEELRSTNEELQAQQEELRQTNEELGQQAEELETQRQLLEERNTELDDARQVLEAKAAELTTVSSYKSQFLTNMSHELRTPLNSMLLLSNLLAENATGNLTAKQVEFGKTIYSAGKDLLALINQVLDLAKVEAGKQEVHVESVPLRPLVEHVQRVFDPLARDKHLELVVEVSSALPEEIRTDRQRVEQIIRNLLGNAIKFTEKGRVILRVSRPNPGVRFRRADVQPEHMVAFAVIDMGIGIAPANLDRVFAPFEQVDAAPDRRYGGTGLGLSIARELAILLGGELQLTSVVGVGSTFTFFLPEQAPSHDEAAVAPPPALIPRQIMPPTVPAVPVLLPRDREYVLLIEDDAAFASGMAEVIAAQGLEHQIAPNGETGLRMARARRPSGIVLDLKLPDMDGWQVMEKLRADPVTATIPVHFLSAMDPSSRWPMTGAVGYLTKPATRVELDSVIESLVPGRSAHPCRILVVEDDVILGDSLIKKIADERLEVKRVVTAREGIEAVKQSHFDCMILDLSLPDMDGLEVLQTIERECGDDRPSVIVYTARGLTKGETRRLESYAEAIVLKDGASSTRLIEEIRLFVRRLKDGLRPRRPAAARIAPADLRLAGKKILVADDDMRTVYALSATLLAKGAEVIVADTGRAAVDTLFAQPDVALVLMDIMMPEMDGYEAMRLIRKDARFAKLPIIALTAKAMAGDREKCIEAGADDYMSKPVDADALIVMMNARLS